MKRSIITKISYALFAAGLLASCQKETSTSTGWEYNNINNGGFEKADFEEQRTGPGLVMIEGGTFTMGRTEEDVFDDNNNRPNRFTVSSFYMDRTEVTNFHWLEYVYWMKRVYYKYPKGIIIFAKTAMIFLTVLSFWISFYLFNSFDGIQQYLNNFEQKKQTTKNVNKGPYSDALRLSSLEKN